MALRLVKGIQRESGKSKSNKSREEYLVACLREEVNDPIFTEWDRGFISSLVRQLAQGRKLSEKQKEILERLWEK